VAGRVDGKAALITGGATGIGMGIARCLASEGARVVLASRNEERGEREAATLREEGFDARFVRADVSREGDCQAAVATTLRELGRLDILVNNAGIFPRASLAETTEALWDQIFAVNLKGVFFMCKHAVPAMRQGGGGAIVNIGSANAYVGGRNLFAYSCSKGALITLTRNLANALARERIRVNYVNPGWVITEMETEIQALEGHDEAWLAEAAARRPFGRHERPEDAGWAVVYLASDEAAAVNGEIINVDSGTSLR